MNEAARSRSFAAGGLGYPICPLFGAAIGCLYPVDYPDADVIIMLHRRGFIIQEVPVIMKRLPGKASMHSGFKPFYYTFKMFLSIFVTLLRSKGEEKA